MTRLCIIPRSALSAYCGELQYAEFEHEILRERIRAGIAEARLNGKRFGRPLTAAKEAGQIRKLYRAGVSKAENCTATTNRPHFGAPHLKIAEGLIMPLNTIEKPGEIYQLKVTLLGTDPPIWRRLLVPADLTLERLHDVLQLAMGWEDCHLHEFRIGKQRFGKPDPMEQVFGGPRTASERTAHLSTVLVRARAKAVYTYDFGDSWDHEILVEKCLGAEPGRAYPACLAGERHGPPEDCGGLPGFYNLLEAVSDPEHEQHEELLEWLGSDFDAEAFSVDEVNQRLAPLQRRRKKTAGKSYSSEK